MSLSRKATSGVIWTTFLGIITGVIQVIQGVTLVFFLNPEDFGLVGMIMPLIVLANIFVDLGFSPAIIQKRDTTQKELSTLYWLNILLGLAVFLLFIPLRKFIINFYDEPRLESLIVWISCIFVVTPIGQQYRILLQKELAFNTLAKVEILSAVVGSVCGIVAAIVGWGALSLILATLITTSVQSLLFFLIGRKMWQVEFYINLSGIGYYLRFGLFRTGERIVNYIYSNIDYVIVGRFMGPEVLGYYTVAYEFVILPLQKINPILTRVAFPLFAQIQNDNKALRRGYQEVLKLLTFVTVPILFGFMVFTPLVVPLLFEDKWLLSVPLIQVLAILGILRVISNPAGSILLSKGKADWGFYFNIFTALSSTIVYLWSAQYSIYLLAWLGVFLHVVYTLILWVLLHCLIEITFKELVNSVSTALLYSLITTAITLALHSFLSYVIASAVIKLILTISASILTYLSLCILFQKQYFLTLLQIIFSKPKTND